MSYKATCGLATKLLASAGLIAGLCSSLRADWPAFRGPMRDGIVRGQQVPIEWSQDKNVQWRAELPGQGWSSPVTDGKRIYLTAAISQDENAPADKSAYDLCLIILDAESGSVLRKRAIFVQSADAPSIHMKNSHASPTPIITGERVVLHFGHQGTACTNLSGDVLWKNDSLAYKPVHGNGGTPAIVDGLVIFSRDGGDTAVVTALQLASGEVAWEVQRDVEANKKFSFCTPLVAQLGGRNQLILPGSNVVQSLDPATGKEYWRLRYDGYSVIPRPIVDSGLVFVATGYNQPSLLAIDPTGTGDVTETHLKWQVKTSIPHTPSLIALGGRVTMVSDKGIASCLDSRTGEETWKLRIGGNFSASPLLVGDKLYLLSEQGECSIVDLSSDRPKIIMTNDIEERTLASFAVLDDTLLLRSDKALYRIHP